MMIDLRETPDGIILPIKVSAGSRVAGLRGVQDGALKVSVTVAPEKGKANKAVLKLLAAELDLPKSSLQIIAGETNTLKQVLIRNSTPQSLLAKMDELMKS